MDVARPADFFWLHSTRALYICNEKGPGAGRAIWILDTLAGDEKKELSSR